MVSLFILGTHEVVGCPYYEIKLALLFRNTFIVFYLKSKQENLSSPFFLFRCKLSRSKSIFSNLSPTLFLSEVELIFQLFKLILRPRNPCVRCS